MRLGERLLDGALRDLIEDDALDLFGRQVEGLGQVPRDRFPFPVEVGREIDDVRVLRELQKLVDRFLVAGEDFVHRLEVPARVHPVLMRREVADVPL